MSKLEKKYGAWIYTSDGGHEYTIGQITAEYNVIIDEFGDIIDLFDTGEFICNYPNSPRKMDMTVDDIARIIKEVFGNVEKVGGTKSAPIWRMRKMAN